MPANTSNKGLEIKVPKYATEIVLSIKPQHAEKIYAGVKKFELRKALPSRVPRKIYLYETEGTGAITGHIIIDRTLSGKPSLVWREIEGKGIERDRYNKYYQEQTQACVYGIQHAVKYEEPLSLTALKQIFDFKPPQHFTYLSLMPNLASHLNDLSMESLLNNETLEKISVRLLEEANYEDFTFLVDKSISANYANTGLSYPAKLIAQFKHKEAGLSLTTRRKFIFEIVEEKEVAGYLVLTQKNTGAYKTAPFCLHETFVNKGIGPKIRSLIHQIVQKHGGRKVYCTVPTSNKHAINYLLTSNYQIEAHLINHYHNNHSDVVYGYNLSLAGEIEHHAPRPETTVSKAKLHQRLTPTLKEQINEHAVRLLSECFAPQYTNYILEKVKSGKIHLLAYDQPIGIIALLEPKTNQTVRIHIYLEKHHAETLKKLITLAELEATSRFNAKKIFTTVDVLDFELLPTVLGLGYRPEGVLKSVHNLGNNMMILSKFLEPKT